MLILDLERKRPVYHLFKNGDKKYIFDYRNLFYSELNDTLYNLFRYFDNDCDISFLNGMDQRLTVAE